MCLIIPQHPAFICPDLKDYRFFKFYAVKSVPNRLNKKLMVSSPFYSGLGSFELFTTRRIASNRPFRSITSSEIAAGKIGKGVHMYGIHKKNVKVIKGRIARLKNTSLGNLTLSNRSFPRSIWVELAVNPAAYVARTLNEVRLYRDGHSDVTKNGMGQEFVFTEAAIKDIIIPANYSLNQLQLKAIYH